MALVIFGDLRAKFGIPYVRDHLRRKVRAGEFPAPVQISNRRIGWHEEEIVAWLAALPKQAPASAAPTH